MNVLSLFDGISCSRVALERSGIDVKTYYACEIEKNAIKVSQKNYPDVIQLGSVVGLVPPNNIDLLIGGSPCQDLSICKKNRKGLDGERSGLFWEFVRIKKECNPKWFILENVNSMPKEAKEIITREMGVEPVMFNASLVSAQNRKRLFWTNIPFTLPEDKNILLKDILVDGEVHTELTTKDGKAHCLTASYSKASASPNQIEHSIKKSQRTMVIGHIGKTNSQANRVYDINGKSVNLTANAGGLGGKTGLYKINNTIRVLSPIECERLQGLPDNYTECIANTNRYKCLGNAFNVDVVSHILKYLDINKCLN